MINRQLRTQRRKKRQNSRAGQSRSLCNSILCNVRNKGLGGPAKRHYDWDEDSTQRWRATRSGLEVESSGCKKAVKLLEKGRDVSRFGQISAAEDMLRQAIDLAKDDPEVQGAATYRLGQQRELRGDAKGAIKLYDEVLSKHEASRALVSQALRSKAGVKPLDNGHAPIFSSDERIKMLTKSLTAAKGLKDRFQLVVVYDELARFFWEQKNYISAEMYFRKSIDMAMEDGFDTAMYSKHAYSMMLRQQGKVQEADAIDQECIIESQQKSNVLHRVMLANLANRESQAGNHHEARKTLRKIRSVQESLGHTQITQCPICLEPDTGDLLDEGEETLYVARQCYHIYHFKCMERSGFECVLCNRR